MCDTYNCDYLQHNAYRFNLINFQLNRDFPFPILRFFYCEITYRNSKIVSQEDAFKRPKTRRFLFLIIIIIINSFTLIENNFRFLW